MHYCSGYPRLLRGQIVDAAVVASLGHGSKICIAPGVVCAKDRQKGIAQHGSFDNVHKHLLASCCCVSRYEELVALAWWLHR